MLFAEYFAIFRPIMSHTAWTLRVALLKTYCAEAGTLSYVITELLFWAIAFPTEC